MPGSTMRDTVGTLAQRSAGTCHVAWDAGGGMEAGGRVAMQAPSRENVTTR